MENGLQNGVSSNHDRAANKDGEGSGATGANSLVTNGAGESSKAPTPKPTQKATGGSLAVSLPDRTRMNDLPDEIRHITQGFIPLSTILIRLAQATYDDLQKAVMDSANIKWMPAAINGGNANGSDLPDDNSEGNRKRKMTLLKFAQEAHTKWVKALVIADWSRKAESVSKLIDLKAHLDEKRMLFDHTQAWLITLKRDLSQARLPRPDLKTALQILTTGEASWIPEPGYLPLPILTPEEQLHWIEELNTLLSLRLNLEDYDKVPKQFKDYDIQSGRVTFKVKGEFEVDLTIADEDFEKQFWFIDFRFAFSPATGKLSDGLMNFLEGQVNDILGRDGLKGCYKFLHEFVLTHKINELKRQAIDLSRSSWTGNLKVEPLNRALAIQYWTNRYPANAPKSWVMVAVHSGKEKNGEPDPKHPSRLVARWYRDNKEMKAVTLPLDTHDLSADKLLKSAIARHVEHILSSIHAKLSLAPRFVKRETCMKLTISHNEPLESSLDMQLGVKEKVTLIIEPVTGFAAVQPHTRYALQGETRLNHSGKDPAEDGVVCLENIRWGFVLEEFNRRGRSAGWNMTKSPISGDDIKRIIKTRDSYQPVFFQRQGLGENWWVMLSLCLSGDEWWLIQTRPREQGSKEQGQALSANMRLPFTKGQPDLDETFWSHLTTFAAGLIFHVAEFEELHGSGVMYKPSKPLRQKLPREVRMPAIRFKLSDVLSPRHHSKGPNSSSSGPAWAKDMVEVVYKGLRSAPSTSDEADVGRAQLLGTTVDALLKVRDRSKFKHLSRRIDRDITYDRRAGQFTFRLRGRVGRSIFNPLSEHIRAIDKLVSCLDAISRNDGSVKIAEVSLRRLKFSYPDVTLPGKNTEASEPKYWTATLDMSGTGISLVLEDGNPHLRVLDFLTKLVNKRQGLSVLMVYLTMYLPILKVADAIERKWQSLDEAGQSEVQVLPKTSDWLALVYTLAPPSKGATAAASAHQRAIISVHTRYRNSSVFWYVERQGAKDKVAEDDDVAKVLKPIWTSNGENWRGLSTGATASLKGGIVDLLLKIDEALSSYVSGQLKVEEGDANNAIVLD